MDGDSKENAIVRPPIDIKRLYGQCFEATKIVDEALIPVGGTLPGRNDIFVKADFENFKDFYDETHNRSNKYSLEGLKKWTTDNNIPLEPKLLATLMGFTEVFGERYPRSKIQEGRFRAYSGKRELTLSELFANNTIACAEIAALAQSYLQREGIASKYFSGDVLWDKNHEFSESHTFIVIPQGERQIIYDPTNPTKTKEGSLFPSIYTTDANFDAEVSTKKRKLIETRNILFKNKVVAYFGANGGTNVAEESLVQMKI